MIRKTKIKINLEKLREVESRVAATFGYDGHTNQICVTSIKESTDPLYSASGPNYDNNGELNRELNPESFTEINTPFKGTYIEEILKIIPYRWSRVRLMKLMPRSCYCLHADKSELPRLHIAITTHPYCYFFFEPEKIFRIPADSYLYEFETELKHTAFNASLKVERVHLVIETL